MRYTLAAPDLIIFCAVVAVALLIAFMPGVPSAEQEDEYADYIC